MMENLEEEDPKMVSWIIKKQPTNQSIKSIEKPK